MNDPNTGYHGRPQVWYCVLYGRRRTSHTLIHATQFPLEHCNHLNERETDNPYVVILALGGFPDRPTAARFCTTLEHYPSTRGSQPRSVKAHSMALSCGVDLAADHNFILGTREVLYEWRDGALRVVA